MATLTLFLSLLAVFGFTALALWKPSTGAVLFMLAAAAAVFTGLSWPNADATPRGVAMGMLFIAYGLFCIGLAFRHMFWRREEE